MADLVVGCVLGLLFAVLLFPVLWLIDQTYGRLLLHLDKRRAGRG